MKIWWLAVMLAVAPVAARADGIWFRAQLRGDVEVPSVTTTGRGEAEVLLDTELRELRWTVKYQDLLTPLSAAHFHGPATWKGPPRF